MAPAKHLPVHGAQFSRFDIDPEIGGDDDHLSIGEQDEDEHGEDDDDFFGGEDDDDIYMIDTSLTNQHVPIHIMPLRDNTFRAASQHVERVCQVPGQSIYKSGGLMCSVCSTMLGMCISSGLIVPPSEDSMKDYQSYLVSIMSQSAR